MTTETPAPALQVVSPYGDERIARDHSLAVVIEARWQLAALHREDELSKRPLRSFSPAELEEVYERASDTINARIRSRAEREQLESTGSILGEIQSIADRAIAQQQALPCEGLVEHLDRCTVEVKASCPERAAVWCPRNVVRYTRYRARFAGEPATPKERLEDMRIPEEIVDFLLGKPDKQGRKFTPMLEPCEKVRAWLQDAAQPSHLFLGGGTGIGKTVAAAWALDQAGGLFVSAYGVASHFRDEEWLSRVIGAVPLLVVDEVGGEDLTEWSKAAIARIAYERGAKRTIWTSNVAREVLVERYTERFVDRVASGSHAWMLGGESLR